MCIIKDPDENIAERNYTLFIMILLPGSMGTFLLKTEWTGN